MSFPAYPDCTDSGVPWLGNVPSHWEVSPVKAVATFNDEVLTEATEPDLEIDYIEISDVQERTGVKAAAAITFGAAPSRARRVVRAGDILVSTVRTYLRAIAPVPSELDGAVASTGFCVIRGRLAQSGFLGYALRAEAFVAEVIARSVGVSYPAVNASDLVAIKVPLPSPEEQTAIAAFLDRETAKIDALVAEQERLIALLKEKRQAVISHAVTKGLNPNAPMKDSGIEWLGEIPAHWDILPLTRVIAKFVDYRGATPNKVDDGVPLITATQIKNGRIDHSLDPVFISEEEYETRMTRGFPARGDLLLTTEAPLGEAALIEEERVAPGQRIILMKMEPGLMTSPYLLAHFRSQFGQSELWTRASGSTASGIRADRLRASNVLVPPVEDQSQIVAHIDSITSTYDKLFAEAQSAISLLQERRAALISAAVTGKIDVRGLAETTQELELA